MRAHQAFGIPMVVTLAALCGTTTPSAQITRRNVNGTIWVANRGMDTIRGFDASNGEALPPIQMRAGSQPGDLAYANGKLYVAEERATPPAIAIVNPSSGQVIKRLEFPNLYRPHHVHASASGELVAVGLYGTDQVAVVETENDTLLGPAPTGTWHDPSGPAARVHAGVFSQDGETLYILNDATGKLTALASRTGTVLWSMNIPGAHEMIVTHNNKIAFVSRRPFNRLARVDLEECRYVEECSYKDVLEIGLPDTLDMSANEKMLTVGLRTSPAQMAVVETDVLLMDSDALLNAGSDGVKLVTLAPAGSGTTIGGHQWTTPNGQYTFASYEGATSAGLVVIDHGAGNEVVQRVAYPGGPHGVTHVPPHE
jgi:outer membrane protein assembly factor BamB